MNVFILFRRSSVSNIMLYVRYVYLKKDKHIYKRQTHLFREGVTQGLEKKKNSGHEPQEAWRQGELIVGNPPVVK
jgi:hypothetical protein